MADLKGKTVLITGAARHLGKAMAVAFARAGARIAVTYLSSAQTAQKTLKQIRELGAEAIAVPCDVRDGKSIVAAVDNVLEKFRRIDVLVNNAGFYETVAFQELTEEQWDNMYSINVRGPFLMSKRCIPALQATKGKIIHIGSLGAEKPWASHAHYCSSKAALHALTRIMAKALAPEIAVNCVAPGMIAHGTNSDEAMAQRFAEITPMRRNGTAEDVVSAVLFFATAPHFITGQILTVDGGLGLK